MVGRGADVSGVPAGLSVSPIEEELATTGSTGVDTVYLRGEEGDVMECRRDLEVLACVVVETIGEAIRPFRVARDMFFRSPGTGSLAA